MNLEWLTSHWKVLNSPHSVVLGLYSIVLCFPATGNVSVIIALPLSEIWHSCLRTHRKENLNLGMRQMNDWEGEELGSVGRVGL